MTAATSPTASAPAWSSVLRGCAVLALLALWTAVFWGPAHSGSVISDGWVLLGIGARGFAEAPFALLSYHTIPVANLWSALLWKICGTRESWYQLINLGELALVGWVLYLLGAALYGRRRALLASLLFLSHPAFYEIPLWPGVGNFQSLATLLWLAAVSAAHLGGRGWHPRWAAAAYFVSSLLAFFTYEPTVSLLPVGVVAALLAADGSGPFAAQLRERLRAARPVLVGAALLALIVLGSKAWTASQGYHAAFFPQTMPEVAARAQLLVRGTLSVFTLVAADDTLYNLMTLGLGGGWNSPLALVATVAWLLILGGLVVTVLRRGGNATRLLVVAMVCHLGLTAVATNLVSRHFYVTALPGCLLLVLALERLAAFAAVTWQRLAGGRTTPRPDLVALLTMLALALLVARGQTDMTVAHGLYQEASQASRDVRAELTRHFAQRSRATRALLVDMPANLPRGGIGIMPFVNGLHDLARLTTGVDANRVSLAAVGGPWADGRVANGSARMAIPELLALIDDPSWLVLAFDPVERLIHRLDADTFEIPSRYTPRAVPFLLWRQEWDRPDWLFAVEDSLELPLATPGCAVPPAAPDCQVRLELATDGGRAAVIQVGETRASAGPAGADGERWRTLTLPVTAAPVTWVQVERDGGQPVLLRRLEVVR